MDKILIFIPMYNCRAQIGRVLEKIASLGPDQALFAKVLVVDNGSTDGSREAALAAMGELAIPAQLIQNKENYSLGGSHKVAFGYALEGDYTHVVVLHGDDQGDIRDLVPYLKKGEFRRWDCFLGSRFAKGSKLVGYDKFRIFGNHVFNGVMTAATGRRITDLGSGLNLYKTSFLQSKFYLPFPNDLSFNVFLLLYGVHAKARFRFFPLTWREEDQVSNAKLAAQTKRMLGLLEQYVFHRKKVFAPKDNPFSQIDYQYVTIGEHTP